MSTRKSAIGNNPLDSIIALPGGPRETVTSQEEQVGERAAPEHVTSQGVGVGSRRGSARATSQESGGKRTRLTVKVSDEMVEELRDAVMFLHTQGVHTTLVGLIESAVDAELKRIKRKYNEGQDLPSRRADLPVGRPISA